MIFIWLCSFTASSLVYNGDYSTSKNTWGSSGVLPSQYKQRSSVSHQNFGLTIKTTRLSRLPRRNSSSIERWTANLRCSGAVKKSTEGEVACNWTQEYYPLIRQGLLFAMAGGDEREDDGQLGVLQAAQRPSRYRCWRCHQPLTTDFANARERHPPQSLSQPSPWHQLILPLREQPTRQKQLS